MGSGDRLALCLHGFPEHAYSWRYQMPLLARLGYRVWAPNLRGYGNSDSPQEVSAYKTRTLVEDVAALITAAKPRETLLLAHDWGGALAWSLALEQPQLIDKLIIMNLPHPACFARELRRPPQLFRSWYMFFFQLPWLPELMLRRCNGRATSGVFRSSSRNPARFTDEDLGVYRANAMRPGGLTGMAGSTGIARCFAAEACGGFEAAKFPSSTFPRSFSGATPTPRSAFAPRAARKNMSRT